MKKILTVLDDEGPQTFQALRGVLWKKDPPRSATRTLQYCLSGLKILELIEFDGEYYRRDGRVRRFTQKDRDAALKHSRDLLLSDRENQRFDYVADPFTGLDLLAFKDTTDMKLLRQHIKTGYFKEFYQPLQKYIELMTKLNVRPFDAEIPFNNDDYNYSNRRITNEVKTLTPLAKGWDESINAISSDNGDVLIINSQDTKPSKELFDELFNLRGELVTLLYTLVGKAKHGIPLEGYCDYCPSKHLTIID